MLAGAGGKVIIADVNADAAAERAGELGDFEYPEAAIKESLKHLPNVG